MADKINKVLNLSPGSVKRYFYSVITRCKNQTVCAGRLLGYSPSPTACKRIKRAVFGSGLLSCALLYDYITSARSNLCPSFIHCTFKSRVIPSIHALDPRYNRHNFSPLADVVEKTAPAVVFIYSDVAMVYSGTRPVKGGSGFVIREDGLVLTNAHVVDRSSRIIVKLANGDTYDGTLQAVDVVSDLATIKIEANNLPTLKLGDSDSIRAGEYVVALGNPLGLNNTVTAGIVSMPKRKSSELGLHGKNIHYIQTDAVITVGNSGGPLVNMDGEAIGVNAMKGASAGISFAIPSDYVKTFLSKAEKIEKRSGPQKRSFWEGGARKEQRRYIGVTMMTLTPSILHDIKTVTSGDFPDVEHGVLIQGVVVGGPAAKAGILPGTVIMEINGKEVHSSSDVYNAVNGGAELKMEIVRRLGNGGYERQTVVVFPEDTYSSPF